MPLRVGGEDGRVVVVGVRSLVGCGLRIGLSGSLSRVGVLGRLVSPRFLGRFSGLRAALVGRLVDGGFLSCLLFRGLVLRLIGPRLPNLVGIRGHLVGGLRLCIGLSGSLSPLGVLGILGRLLCLRLDTGLTRVAIGSILSRAGVLDVRVLRSRALSLVALNVFGVLVRLVSPRFLGRFSGLRAALVGRLVDGGVLDVRVLRSRALSLGILSALGVLGRLLCLRLDTSFARVAIDSILSVVLCLVTRIVGARLLSFAGCGIRIGLGGSLSRRLRDLRVLNHIRALDGFFCVLVVTSLARVGASDAFDLIAVNRPGLISGLVLVHRRAAVSGRLRRLGRLRLRRVPLTESRVHSGLAGRTISRSRSPCVTHATSSTGGRVVGQVAARPEIGEDLDVPGTGQPAEQVGIGGRVGRQRRPQVGPALCDGGLQGLVRSLSGNRRIGLMRRHHELNRIHAEPFRENVWVTSTDRVRSQPILGPYTRLRSSPMVITNRRKS